jgi:two-component system, NtrC family, sensor histidine kinase HydH
MAERTQTVSSPRPLEAPAGELHNGLRANGDGIHFSPAPGSSDNDDSERFRRQYNEIATLAGGLAHELRNPLSTIRMNLGLLVEDLELGDNPQQQRIGRKLETIQRECTRLDELLNAFLQFARAGEPDLHERDISRLVAEFIDFYQPEARTHGIDVSPHLSASLPPVLIDANLLRVVLLNLARNAQQAMPEGGQLEIQTASRDGRVILQVIDSGPGMPEAVRRKLFDVFFSTRPNGSGLGLPTVRKIVEAHGGTIEIESEVGRGTRFTLSFPAARSSRW